MLSFSVKLMLCVLIEELSHFVFRVDAQEMKKESKYCIWDPDNSTYAQDDLKSITVPLYLKGAKIFRRHFSVRLKGV